MRINQNGINYELNKNNLIAKVVNSPYVSNSVWIPREVIYDSNKYIVIELDSSAFERNQNITSLFFDKDSQVKTFGKNIINITNITHISIPASLQYVEEGWCCGSQSLIEIDVSPQNKYFQFVDDQLLIMSNEQNDEKVLVFAARNSKNVTIPSYVTRIASHSFQNCNSIKFFTFEKDSKLRSISSYSFQFAQINKLVIPSTLENLEEGWCCSCSSLKEIEISPDHKYLKNIDGKYLVGKGKKEDEQILLFVKRDVVDCIVPSCITRIGSYSFEACNSLKTIIFENDSKLKEIGNDAFSGSSLKSLTLPPSLEKIEENWCSQVNSLDSIVVVPNSKKFIFINDTFLVSQKNEKESVLLFAKRSIEDAYIPSFITRIANFAFYNCFNLKSVVFEKDSSLIEIGENAFNYCPELTIVSPIPASVRIIDSYAFQYCSNLQSVSFVLTSQNGEDSALEVIEEGAFDSCENLSSVSTIPRHVKKISNFAFGGCQCLESILFQEGAEIESFGREIFSYTNIKNIPIPAGLKGLPECFYVLGTRNLIHFEISAENKNNIFVDDKLLITKVDDEVILNYANPDVVNVVIPSNVTRIGSSSFNKCKNLQTVSFASDSKIKSIGEKSFMYSTITRLELPESLETIDDNWCFNVYDLVSLEVSPMNKYFKLLDEKLLIKKFDENDFFKGYDLIFAYRNINSVFIPSFIGRINTHAFGHCTKLKSVEFEDTQASSLKEIGSSAFAYCDNLCSIVSIPSSLEIINGFCFSNCNSLTSVEFLGEELSLHYGAFLGCMSISLLSFPNSQKITFWYNIFLQVQNEIIIYTQCDSKIIQISP